MVAHSRQLLLPVLQNKQLKKKFATVWSEPYDFVKTLLIATHLQIMTAFWNVILLIIKPKKANFQTIFSSLSVSLLLG